MSVKASPLRSRSSDGSTSKSLLAKVRRNDDEAWERLIGLYAPVVYRACLKARLPHDDIADVFQEVFQSVARGIHDFRKAGEGDSLRGWVFAITRNKIRDRHRRLRKEPRAVGGTEQALRLASVESPGEPDEEGDPVPRERAESWLLREALERIRGSFREATWLAFRRTAIDGRSAADAGEELGMSPGAVRVAKSRVLQRLREELGDLF